MTIRATGPSFRSLYSAQTVEAAAKEASRAVSGRQGNTPQSYPQLGVPVEKVFRAPITAYQAAGSRPSGNTTANRPPMASAPVTPPSTSADYLPPMATPAPDMAAPSAKGGKSGGGGQASWDLPGEQAEDSAPPFPMPRFDAAAAGKAIQPVSHTVLRKPSLWDRLLAFLGLQRRSATMSGEMSQEEGVASVVKRARCGDQNAMAIIARVRDNAAKGNPTAARSVELMKAYIAANPASDFGGEARASTADPSMTYAIMLHNKGSINTSIARVLATYNEDEQLAFAHGMLQRAIADLPKELRRAAALGRAIGLSKSIEYLRSDGSRVSNVNHAIGWELGE